MKNSFSVKPTTENMQMAKAGLIKYFKTLQYARKQVCADIDQESKLLLLKQILNNFYMFWNILPNIHLIIDQESKLNSLMQSK